MAMHRSRDLRLLRPVMQVVRLQVVSHHGAQAALFHAPDLDLAAPLRLGMVGQRVGIQKGQPRDPVRAPAP